VVLLAAVDELTGLLNLRGGKGRLALLAAFAGGSKTGVSTFDDKRALEFGVNDAGTADYLSSLLGARTVMRHAAVLATRPTGAWSGSGGWPMTGRTQRCVSRSM
jgi:hypothetical protein